MLIVGAGPAGLVLGNLLRAAGIDTLVLERGGRDQVQARARAGFLGANSARVLTEHGLGTGMLCNVGGRERTESHYRALLAGAGFELAGVRPLALDAYVLRAVRIR